MGYPQTTSTTSPTQVMFHPCLLGPGPLVLSDKNVLGSTLGPTYSCNQHESLGFEHTQEKNNVGPLVATNVTNA